MSETAEQRRRQNQKKRNIIQSHKEVPCMDCGERYPPYVMDFDHRENETKRLLVSRVAHHGLGRLLDEIAKCDVVCANCHRKRTHERKHASMSELAYDSGSNPEISEFESRWGHNETTRSARA